MPKWTNQRLELFHGTDSLALPGVAPTRYAILHTFTVQLPMFRARHE